MKNRIWVKVTLIGLIAIILHCGSTPKIEYATQSKTLGYMKRCTELDTRSFTILGYAPNESELAEFKKVGGSEDYQVLYRFTDGTGILATTRLAVRFWQCAK